MSDRYAVRRLDAHTTEAYRSARILRTFKSGSADGRKSESQRVSSIVEMKQPPQQPLML
jgi:hypothetical protein